MTFCKAFEYAMKNSEVFRKFDKMVERAIENGTDSGCMVFTIGQSGETFYYGFDGVDLHQGKHTARRAQILLNRGEAYTI